jgi:hypothetical protein
VKHNVYFFLCGITTDISLTSSKILSLLLAAGPSDMAFLLMPLAGREGTASSSFRFLDAGSDDSGVILETWRAI